MIRAGARTREFRVRLALGARRSRLVHQVLIESLVFAGAGAALGVGLAWLTVRLLVRMAPAALGLARVDHVAIDFSMLLFVTGLTGVVTLLCGIGPALACSRSDQAALPSSSRSIASGQRRVQRTLVVAQMALAVPLLAGAGLMVQSLYRLSRVDPGFRPEGVLTVRMLLLPVRNRAFHAEFVADALGRVRALPGVLAAGSIARLPLDGGNTASWYYRADRPELPLGQRPAGDISIVTPGYFAAMGIPLLRGRDFDHRDRIGSPPVALLNATAARRFFGADDPVGRRLTVSWNDAREVEIIGVTGDIRHNHLDRVPEPCLFLPNDQQPFPLSALVIRTAGDPHHLAEPVKRAIRSADPDQGVGEIQTLSDLVSGAMAARQAQAALFAAFGALALILTCVGVYGVLAYTVSQRTRELGLRLALGATRRAACTLVLRDGLALAATGLLIGLGAAMWLTRFMQRLLFEVSPLDERVFASVTLGLMLAATAACAVPAAAATRVDPAIVLRDE
jgi:putative ABC transport system permease protein